jgi:hypothetical protein
MPKATSRRSAVIRIARSLSLSSSRCDPQPLSPQTQALKAILERLDPQKPQPNPTLLHRVKRIGSCARPDESK